MNSQNLELTQKIGIRLSQQQLRFVRMLELNAPELDEAVERELEDNPALGVRVCAAGMNIIFDYGRQAVHRRQNSVVKSQEFSLRQVSLSLMKQ